MTNISHAPKPTDEEEFLTENQEEEQDVGQKDEAQLSTAIHFGGALFFWRSDRHTIFANAYNTLTDPGLAENLLDFTHPENTITVRHSLRIAEKELKKKRNVQRGYTQTKFLFWKSNKITPHQHEQALYATILARKMHQGINSRTRDLKFQTMATQFGMNSQDLAILKKSTYEWLAERENHGKTLDEALLHQAKKRGLSKKEIKKTREDLETARKTAIKEAKESGRVDRAKKVLAEGINNRQELKEALSFVETGAPPASKLAKGFAEIPSEHADAIMGLDAPSQPAAHRIPRSPSRQIRPSTQLLPQKFFGGFRSKIGSFFKKGLGSLFKKGKSMLSGITSAAGILGKQLISRGLDAIAPGLGAVSQKINNVIANITGVDLMGTATNIGIAIVLLIAVGLPILFILLLSGETNMFSHVTSKNPVVVSSSIKTMYSWQGFERKFLSLEKEGKTPNTEEQDSIQVTWHKFEKENLLPYDKYLSLE